MTEKKLDENLYSRQIGTFGMETMGKLIKMKVLLIGLRGLGVETAKNIILAGPAKVTIFDSTIVQINDLGSNFFLTEEHVGKERRDKACLSKLAELNPYVECDVLESNNDIYNTIKNYSIVVITEVMDKQELIKINRICRENKIGFIYSAELGITGFLFVDFGKEHFICDHNGEECKTYLCKIIANDEVGSVTIDDTVGTGKLSLETGDSVVFREVKGMTELNDGKPRQITFISPVSFGIGDTRKFGEYQGGGIIEQVKVPKPAHYKSFEEKLETPYDENPIDPIDLAKFGRNELLHAAVIAIHNYYEKEKCLPELNNGEQTNKIVEETKNVIENLKKNGAKWIDNSEEFNEKLISCIGRWARAEISPICAFLGGIVAQEIVKLTGKYTPINQWLWFDFYETVANLENNIDRKLSGTRYDDQIAIYGNEIQCKLKNSDIFMVGAGALGCEFLKNFALMGIATSKDKCVTVTDNDNIEISNLNRQFLFRKDNVGKSKSKCACEAIRKMNSDFNCKDLLSRVGPENEHIFNEAFWKNQTFIINAVDNINARKYIDNQCTIYGCNLIDSGTLGTKAHMQLIIPHVTTCYNDSQDPVEEAVPMCTLHNFPSMIQHCIEWARDHFNEYFVDSIADAKKLIMNPQAFYDDLKKEGNTTLQLTKLKVIQNLVTIYKKGTFEGCIEFAVKQHTENFNYRICQLLHNFPEDYKNPDGSMFWSGNKRVPHKIEYSPDDELSFIFVKNYAIILARALGIPSKNDDAYIKEVSRKVKIEPFQPKEIKIKVNDNEPDSNDNTSMLEDDDIKLKELQKEMIELCSEKINIEKFKPEEFEKDDDSNGHIDWIHSCSNLRANNYKIKECDRQKSKMIAGRIIPAIATTTASITGLVALQLYTLLQTRKIDFMRNCYMNLGVNIIVLSEPAEKIKMMDKEYDPLLLGPVKAIPPQWTVWDKINVDGSKTCKEFIDFIKEKYDVDVSIIACNGVTIIQTFLPSCNAFMKRKIEDVYYENAKLAKVKVDEGKDYIFLEVSGDIGDASALMPLFKYNFKK